MKSAADADDDADDYERTDDNDRQTDRDGNPIENPAPQEGDDEDKEGGPVVFEPHAAVRCAQTPVKIALPDKSWAYSVVPHVVRLDANASFVVEVTAPREVTAVALTKEGSVVDMADRVELDDSGNGADREAGDGVWTAGPFHLSQDTLTRLSPSYGGSLPGIDMQNFARIEGRQNDGTVLNFVVPPSIGLIAATISAGTVKKRNESVSTTAHAVAVCTEGGVTQAQLRSLSGGAGASSSQHLTRAVYAALGDVFDFIYAIPTYHLEGLGGTKQPANARGGIHIHTKNDVTGLGKRTFDSSHNYGSAGQLQGVIHIDTLQRGLSSMTFVHELLHRWGAYFVDFPLTDGAGHFLSKTNAASVLGGSRWFEQGLATFRDCDQSSLRSRQAAPIDLYLMGLVGFEDVPDFLIGAAAGSCNQVVPGRPYKKVTMASIVEKYGERAPGVGDAQKSFRLGFVIDSPGRSVTEAELAFYERLATRFVEPSNVTPAPMLGNDWVPMTQFFGHGTTWRTDVP